MNVSKFLRLSLSAALLTSVVGMTGCGMNAKSNIRTQNVRNDQNHMRPYSTNEAGRYNAGYHHIGSMRFSSALSTQVAKLPGVRAAHVVLTDRDAYVAVRLMENNGTSYNTKSYNRNSTNSYGLNGTTDMNNIRGNRGGSGIVSDIGRAGRDVGRGVVDTGRDIVGGAANTGRNVVNDIGGTGRNMMNDMTGRGNAGNSRMNSYSGTGTGTGMGMNRNNMNNNNMGTNQEQVPQHVRNEITRLIKKSSKSVQNVYISSDESFMNEVEGYSTNSRDGGGVIQDTMTGFERLVNRIFPFGNGDNDMGVNNYRNNRMNNRMNNNMNMNNMDMMDRNPSGYQNGTR